VVHQVGCQFGSQVGGQVFDQFCPQVGLRGDQSRNKVGHQIAVPERVEGEQRLVGR